MCSDCDTCTAMETCPYYEPYGECINIRDDENED